VKNRIYTYLLFGICAAVSITGHSQTKPTNKHATVKTVSTSASHSKHASADKKKPATPVKTKANDKKTPATAKTANKKDAIAGLKSTTKKQIAVSAPINNKNKQSVASAKTTAKKPAIVSAKLKNNKQSVAASKSSRNTNSVASFTSAKSATKIHTVIAAKSIKSVAIKSASYKKPEKTISSNLELDDVESDPIIDTNNDKTFHPLSIEHLQSTQTNTAHVSIETSLFLDGLEAGLSKELILQLTEIFAWDIDFATNLRPGDQFTIVYGKKIVGGKETDSDEIIAAEFVNQGVSYAAVRYIDESGVSYYTPDGESMQRAFLSAPVDFIKISSPFDPHRKHPILNRIRAHKGIDYAARTGTPVKTTGDGIVTFCGRNGAYGQVVIIQHNDRYETVYAHLSNFKKGLTVGNHVKQSDVIGYVGQTGLATGPHLHYEFHVDGIYRDPETVKIPHSMPISNVALADFKAQTQTFFAQLNQVKAQNLVAKNHSANALPPASMQTSHYD
jgi:murein DD-endopeptidase MepM/ murein hydrolase activator NlpD